MKTFNNFDLIAGMVSVYPFITPELNSGHWGHPTCGTGLTNFGRWQLPVYVESVDRYHKLHSAESSGITFNISFIGMAPDWDSHESYHQSDHDCSLHVNFPESKDRPWLDVFWKLFDEVQEEHESASSQKKVVA